MMPRSKVLTYGETGIFEKSNNGLEYGSHYRSADLLSHIPSGISLCFDDYFMFNESWN